ncbi:hypothetical protein GCM10023069_01620 [Shinella granuli]
MAEVNGRRLLFDVGRGTLSSLARMNIPITAIDRVFITHHHYDHIGELAELIISGWTEGRTTEPTGNVAAHCDVPHSIAVRSARLERSSGIDQPAGVLRNLTPLVRRA